MQAGVVIGRGAQLTDGRRAIPTLNGVIFQEGQKWVLEILPDGGQPISIAASGDRLVVLTRTSAWTFAGSKWKKIEVADEWRSVVGDGMRAYLTSGLSLYCLDEGDVVRRIATFDRRDSRDELRRIGGRAIYFRPLDRRFYALSPNEITKVDELAGEAYSTLNLVWVELAADGSGYYFDGSMVRPVQQSIALSSEISTLLASQMGPLTISNSGLLPSSLVQAEGRIWSKNRDGLVGVSPREGALRLQFENDKNNVAPLNFWTANGGFLIGGTDGVLFMPSPELARYTSLDNLEFYQVTQYAGRPAILTSRGLHDLTGALVYDAPRPFLGMVQDSQGELLIAERGELHWGNRVLAVSDLQTNRVYLSMVDKDRVAISQRSGLTVVSKDGRVQSVELPSTLNEVAPLALEPGFIVATRQGAIRMNSSAKSEVSFGRGLCRVYSTGTVTLVADQAGDLFDANGRRLGHLPFPNLVGAAFWRGQLYLLGQFVDRSQFLGTFDLTRGTWSPVDVPLFGIATALVADESALYVLSDTHVMRVIQAPPLVTPQIELSLRRVSGESLVSSELPSVESEVVLVTGVHAVAEWNTARVDIKIDDADWRPVDTGSALRIQRLGYGTHSIATRVRLANLSSEQTVSFRRKTPWWAGWQGFILYITAASAGVFAAIWWRTRAAVKRSQILEQAVHERTELLHKANLAKNEFIACMNHEVRNPLNGVIGITEMLGSLEANPRSTILLTSLRACAEQLRAAMDGILDYSAIERGDLKLNEEAFDLIRLVQEVQVQAITKGGEVEISGLWPPACSLLADHSKIRIILGNFVSNALKYGVPSRCSISMQLRGAARSEMSELTLRVSNLGPTLSREEIAMLFQPFVRGSRAQATGESGTGLGLSTCRRYASALGGEVGVESVEGVTTFFVRVPVRSVDVRSVFSAHAREGDHAGSFAPTTCRILAIEDEKYNRLALGHYLSRCATGEPDWAGNAGEAVELIRKNRYDLVLTDWSLPDAKHGEIVARLLSAAKGKAPPIVVVSASASDDAHQKAIAAGATDFIPKPIALAKLQQVIATCRVDSANSVLQEDSVSEILSAGIDFNRLQTRGVGGEVFTAYAEDLELRFSEIKKLAVDDWSATVALIHTLRSMLLLVGESSVSRELAQLEANGSDTMSEAERVARIHNIEPKLLAIANAARSQPN